MKSASSVTPGGLNRSVVPAKLRPGRINPRAAEPESIIPVVINRLLVNETMLAKSVSAFSVFPCNLIYEYVNDSLGHFDSKSKQRIHCE